MKKVLILIIYCFIFEIVIVTSAFAQINGCQITTYYPTSGLFSKQDVFDFNINNFSGHVKEGRLEINLIESSSHSQVLNFLNQHIKIDKGINIYTASDFSESWFMTKVSRAFQSNGILPNGSYELCIQLDALNGESGQIKECFRIVLKDEFFIHLLTPGDMEDIETLNPLLQWYCNSSDAQIKYHLVLAPLGQFSKAEDALANSLKYIEIDLQATQYLYPFQAIPLQYGKYYAWQVMAMKENTILGISEAWTFRPLENKESNDNEKDCYRIIYKQFNNGNYLYGDVMKFAYKNSTSEVMLNYSVRDLTTGEIIEDPPRLELKPGLNKIDLELKQLKGIHKGHQYLVQIRNRDNEIYKLTFNPYQKEKMRE